MPRVKQVDLLSQSSPPALFTPLLLYPLSTRSNLIYTLLGTRRSQRSLLALSQNNIQDFGITDVIFCPVNLRCPNARCSPVGETWRGSLKPEETPPEPRLNSKQPVQNCAQLFDFRIFLTFLRQRSQRGCYFRVGCFLELADNENHLPRSPK